MVDSTQRQKVPDFHLYRRDFVSISIKSGKFEIRLLKYSVWNGKKSIDMRYGQTLIKFNHIFRYNYNTLRSLWNALKAVSAPGTKVFALEAGTGVRGCNWNMFVLDSRELTLFDFLGWLIYTASTISRQVRTAVHLVHNWWHLSGHCGQSFLPQISVQLVVFLAENTRWEVFAVSPNNNIECCQFDIYIVL